MNNFADYLGSWANKKFGNGYGDRKKAAEFLGVGVSYLSNLISKKKGTPEKKRREIAQKIGVPYEQMIGQSAEPNDQKPYPSENICPSCGEPTATFCESESELIVLKHCKVVREFPDAELAFEINQNLLKIAKANPERFKELAIHIKVAAEILDNKAPDKERKNGTG